MPARKPDDAIDHAAVIATLERIVLRATRPAPTSATAVPVRAVPAALIEEARALLGLPK